MPKESLKKVCSIFGERPTTLMKIRRGMPSMLCRLRMSDQIIVTDRPIQKNSQLYREALIFKDSDLGHDY
jgi:hypothetical protein